MWVVLGIVPVLYPAEPSILVLDEYTDGYREIARLVVSLEVIGKKGTLRQGDKQSLLRFALENLR